MSSDAPALNSLPPLIVVMGVSGSGKSSVGSALARRLGVEFIEGDALHPEQNIQKMASGIALGDEDRWPWLDLIGEALEARRAQGKGAVVSCSALRRSYRERLRAHVAGLRFLHLDGDRALLQSRLQARKAHFMPSSLLDSQLATLEDPRQESGTIVLDIALPVEAIVDAACRALLNQDA